MISTHLSFNFLSYTFDSSVSYLNATIKEGSSLMYAAFAVQWCTENLPWVIFQFQFSDKHIMAKEESSCHRHQRFPHSHYPWAQSRIKWVQSQGWRKHLCVICQGLQARVWHLHPPRGQLSHEDSLPQGHLKSKVSLRFQVDKEQKEAEGGQLQERGNKYKSSF